MVFSQKQQKQLAKAKGQAKQKLMALYATQNGRRPRPAGGPATGRSTRPARRPPAVPKGLANHNFNGFDVREQPLTFSVGPATWITGRGKQEFSTQSGETAKAKLIAFQPGLGRDVMWIVTDGDGISTYQISNGVTATPSSASPDVVQCARGSIRLRNVTAAGNVAGVVHVLRVSTGITVDSVSATFSKLSSFITNHVRTRTYSASELTESLQWDCIPVSQDKYHEFRSPGASTGTEFQDPGVSTILMLFQPTASGAQDYEASFAACHWVRYNESGVLANMAKPPPSCSLALTNSVRNAAEKMGSMGLQIGAYAIDRAASNLANRIPGMLGNLVRQNQPMPPIMVD